MYISPKLVASNKAVHMEAVGEVAPVSILDTMQQQAVATLEAWCAATRAEISTTFAAAGPHSTTCTICVRGAPPAVGGAAGAAAAPLEATATAVGKVMVAAVEAW